MRKAILSVIFSLMLGACSAIRAADRPVIKNLELVSPTMRLLFPLDDVTLTATITPTRTITPSPTITPIGYKSPTPTNTLVPIFPMETTDTPASFFCRSGPSSAIKISGVIWLDKNGNGVRESGESGVAGVQVDVGHSMSSAQTDQDGKYLLPVQSDQWPVTVHLPNRFYSFDVQTQDSDIASIANDGGLLCSGSSYDVGLIPLVENNQPAATKSSGGDNNPPPSCAQEPNNPNCTP